MGRSPQGRVCGNRRTPLASHLDGRCALRLQRLAGVVVTFLSALGQLGGLTEVDEFVVLVHGAPLSFDVLLRGWMPASRSSGVRIYELRLHRVNTRCSSEFCVVTGIARRPRHAWLPGPSHCLVSDLAVLETPSSPHREVRC